MSTSYGFEEQLTKGEKREKELDEFFSRVFVIDKVDMSSQKAGIDRIWTDPKGYRYSVEYKSDEKTAFTGNAFVETISVDRSGKPGWAYSSCAQVLVYYVPSWHKAYCITMLTIKHKLQEWCNTYSTAPALNREYNTVGLLIPMSEFEKYCFRIFTV
jgi:hypothetical protein